MHCREDDASIPDEVFVGPVRMDLCSRSLCTLKRFYARKAMCWLCVNDADESVSFGK